MHPYFLPLCFHCFSASSSRSSVHPSIHLSFDLLQTGRDWTDQWDSLKFQNLPHGFYCLTVSLPHHSLPFINNTLKTLDVAVGLQWGEENVEEPQADEQHGGQDLRSPGPTQLSTDLWSPSVHQSSNTDKGKYGEECDGKSKRARIYSELIPFTLMIDSSDGPCHLLIRNRLNIHEKKIKTPPVTWQLSLIKRETHTRKKHL